MRLALEFPVLFACLLIGLVACARAPVAPVGAVFVIQVGAETFRVLLERPDLIVQSRSLQASGESRVVSGDLAAGDGGFNHGYSWHLVPESIGFFEVAIELCDGLPSFVEQELAYWLGTVGRYCPWSSRVVSEEAPAASLKIAGTRPR